MNLIPSALIPPWVKRVICWVFSPKGGLIILLGVLFAAFVAVMFNKNAEGYIGQLLGLSGDDGIKNEILIFLGLSMGGVLLALQALIANIRAKAMENAANAQADAATAQARAIEEQAKANENTERGQRQERLKNAIEHLGHDSVSIRLGGAYELFHLAQDTENLRQTVMDILCAHIRGTTSDSKYREMYKSKPSEEIQSLLNLLFVQEDASQTFGGLHIDLRGSWLNGAKLYDARLQNAFLPQVHLQEAELDRANLNGAYLTSSKLQFARFTDTRLRAAKLIHAELHCASLDCAQLQGARLDEAHFQGTILAHTNLQGASSLPEISHGFEDRLRKRINEETEIYSVRFSDGLNQAEIDSLVNELSETAAEDARRRLTQHVSLSASHQLPEDRGAITGSYTKEEAEQWIAEYNKAVTENPKENNS